MTRLENHIAGRNVAVLLHGKSVGKFNPERLPKEDWVFASLNHFSLLERNILSQDNRTFSIIALFSEKEMVERDADIKDYFKRDNNLLLTSDVALSFMADNKSTVRKYRNKIILINKSFFPREIYIGRQVKKIKVNTATYLLHSLILGKPKKIVIFGMDGCPHNINTQQDMMETYYSQSTFNTSIKRNTQIREDTICFNKHFEETWKEAEQISGQKCDIFNCSPKTYITAIPSIPYGRLGELS